MIRQYGTIAWKRDEAGRTLLLLITSRDTGRWVVPRGNPVPGLPPHLSAAQEAWEEAGIRGRVTSAAAGDYRYEKLRSSGRSVTAHVVLFPLAVEEESDDWPEAAVRRRAWLAQAEAAEAVQEPDLRALLAGFEAPDPPRGGD